MPSKTYSCQTSNPTESIALELKKALRHRYCDRIELCIIKSGPRLGHSCLHKYFGHALDARQREGQCYMVSAYRSASTARVQVRAGCPLSLFQSRTWRVVGGGI